jgi:hypothetical protein
VGKLPQPGGVPFLCSGLVARKAHQLILCVETEAATANPVCTLPKVCGPEGQCAFTQWLVGCCLSCISSTPLHRRYGTCRREEAGNLQTERRFAPNGWLPGKKWAGVWEEKVISGCRLTTRRLANELHASQNSSQNALSQNGYGDSFKKSLP